MKHKTPLHQQAAYRENNKEKIRAAQRKWRLENPKKVKAQSEKYSSLRRGKDAEVPIERPDELLLTARIKLTDEQTAYLTKNKEMGRPQLYRAFRQLFNRNINKLQLNFALEKIWETAEKVDGFKRMEVAG